jgi:hypothetical protein
MKYKAVNLAFRMLLLAPLSTVAHAGIHIGVGVDLVPPPLYYGPPPAYYSPPPPVYYGPGVIYGEGSWNYGGDGGRRGRGWAHDRWHGGRSWGDHHGRGR